MPRFSYSLCLVCQKHPRGGPDGADELCADCRAKQTRKDNGEPEPKRLSEQSYRSIHRALTEFGYELTLEWVTEKTNELLDGAPYVGGPDMFIHGWLVKAHVLEEASAPR